MVLKTIGLSGATCTIDELHHGDSESSKELFHCSDEILIVVFKGVVASDRELIQAGDYIIGGKNNII